MGEQPADAREFQAHVARNRQPILDVLAPRLGDARTVLELGSGTGEHAWFFAKHLPHLRWQPTEAPLEKVSRADAFRANEPLPNLAPARQLDATGDDWGTDPVDVVYAANVIHIAPFRVCEGIVRGAARHTGAGGRLILYGPFTIEGQHTAPSNAAFDQRLRSGDPSWGVRSLEAVVELAGRSGLALEERVAMPANNFVLLFRR